MSKPLSEKMKQGIMAAYAERDRLKGKGYEFRYSAYGVTVRYQGKSIFDKSRDPSYPDFQYVDERQKAADMYLIFGVDAALKHERGR